MQILVIGGGPGGYVAAIRAAQLGAHVTLVEKHALGGTCLNIGCIPTKALLHAGAVYAQILGSAAYGIKASATVDFAAVQGKKQSIVKQLVNGVAGLLKLNQVTVKRGNAVFAAPDSVLVTGDDGKTERLSADKIIIAAGSVPSIPRISGLNGPHCIDSTGALALEQPPKRMVIIGGGVIGMEMADLYNSFGTHVSVVELLPDILPPMDWEVSAFAKNAFQKKGIDIYTGASVTSVETQENQVVVVADQGNGELRLECDKVLTAVGRHSAAEALELEKAGVIHERGVIEVDAHMQTNVPGIYAIGDCVPGIMLAHVASAQGEVAAENATGHPSVYIEKNVPSCVYTTPELAGVGLTEQVCKKQGIRYKVGKFPLVSNGRSLILNGGEGFVKAITGAEYGELLGLHMVGPYASELLPEGTLALDLEATAHEIISSIHAHPTVGESIREALMATEHRAIHMRNASR